MLVGPGHVLLGPFSVFVGVPAPDNHNVLPLLLFLRRTVIFRCGSEGESGVFIELRHYLMILVDILSIAEFILPPPYPLEHKTPSDKSSAEILANLLLPPPAEQTHPVQTIRATEELLDQLVVG